jgi:hypothetical protein
MLYSLYAREILVPWSPEWRDQRDPRFTQLRRMLESAWEKNDRERFHGLFGKLPEVPDFPDWATEQCQSHRSNVGHPLFSYLKDVASFHELREFLLQETPFDIHFGDILALMLPGIYGNPKAEFSSNFWDEMGRGDAARMHRQLRIDMTNRLDIPVDIYLADIDRFCLEEIRLANMYFHGASNRALLPQAIGMMLATELMVPGRLDHQIQGWRRVGVTDESMQYLIEHTTVDVEHAHGWLVEVVMPLLRDYPHVLPEIALGMARRLEYAGAVCDRMMELLPRVRECSSPSAISPVNAPTK